MLRVRICIPFYNNFDETKSGLRDCESHKEIDFVIEPRQSSPCMFKNRNSLLNDLKSNLKKQKPVSGFDYFLFVDSDISFTFDHVKRLIDYDKDIITCPYLAHVNDGTYHCGEFDPKYPGLLKYNYSKYEKGMKKVDFAPTGFMLIKSSALEKMEFPWFSPLIIEMEDSAWVAGEDVAFCVKAKKYGIEVYCDFDNPVGHKLRKKSDFDWTIYNNINHI